MTTPLLTPAQFDSKREFEKMIREDTMLEIEKSFDSEPVGSFESRFEDWYEKQNE